VKVSLDLADIDTVASHIDHCVLCTFSSAHVLYDSQLGRVHKERIDSKITGNVDVCLLNGVLM
jgi:hypothetical protein